MNFNSCPLNSDRNYRKAEVNYTIINFTFKIPIASPLPLGMGCSSPDSDWERNVGMAP